MCHRGPRSGLPAGLACRTLYWYQFCSALVPACVARVTRACLPTVLRLACSAGLVSCARPACSACACFALPRPACGARACQLPGTGCSILLIFGGVAAFCSSLGACPQVCQAAVALPLFFCCLANAFRLWHLLPAKIEASSCKPQPGTFHIQSTDCQRSDGVPNYPVLSHFQASPLSLIPLCALPYSVYPQG